MKQGARTLGGAVFQQGDPLERLVAVVTAQFGIVVEAVAHRRPARVAEQAAEMVLVELHAAYPGWLPLRHAGDR